MQIICSIDEIDILMDPDNQNPIRVANDGSCEYLMLKVMKVSCDTYATYYPFDTQTYRLVIASWGYNENEIAFVTKGVSTSFYIENGEWEYTGKKYYLIITQKLFDHSDALRLF